MAPKRVRHGIFRMFEISRVVGKPQVKCALGTGRRRLHCRPQPPPQPGVLAAGPSFRLSRNCCRVGLPKNDSHMFLTLLGTPS